jgi:hypothetical protein
MDYFKPAHVEIHKDIRPETTYSFLVLMDAKLSRTDKTLYAIVSGIPILAPQYFTDTSNAHHQYLTGLNEKSGCEKIWFFAQRRWRAYFA